MAVEKTNSSSTFQNICFDYAGEILNEPCECSVAAELEPVQNVTVPVIYNGKPCYKAMECDCVTQVEDFYVWWCTEGTYANSWVLGPLGDENAANIHSVLSNSSSVTYPIGQWELGGSNNLGYIITNSGYCNNTAGECCRKIIASVETYLKYAEAVGLTQSAAVP